MQMFYDETTGTWYDPRAPLVGKYAPKRPVPRAVPREPYTRYIGNVYASGDLLRRAASRVVSRR